MRITELEYTDCFFEALVEIPERIVSVAIDRELDNIAKTSKVRGFRAGKVPRNIIKSRYYEQAKQNAYELCLKYAIDYVIQSKNLQVITSPDVCDVSVNSDDSDIAIVFRLKCGLLPVIVMPDISNIVAIERPVVRDEEIYKKIDSQLAKLALLHVTYCKRKIHDITQDNLCAQVHDQLIIDCMAYIGDSEFSDGCFKSHKFVLGDNTMLDGFDQKLIGVYEGDHIEFDLVLPDNYKTSDGINVGGNSVTFHVDVKEIYEPTPREIDDEFAKILEFESLEILRKTLEAKLRSIVEYKSRMYMTYQLFNDLDRMLTFELPESLVQNERDMLKRQNLDLDDEFLSRASRRRVKMAIFISKYAEVYGIEVPKQESSNKKKAGDSRDAVAHSLEEKVILHILSLLSANIFDEEYSWEKFIELEIAN